MRPLNSILSRVVALHIVAVALTSLAMCMALSWLLNRATDNIHDEAMSKQAAAIASYLRMGPDGKPVLQLPPDLQGIYSQPYNRYLYAVVDENGIALFSSQTNGAPVFSDWARTDLSRDETRHGDATISGVSLRKTLDGKDFWIQTGENLSNRDALTDDITRGFFREVGWITVPILLILLVIDIAIFRRALRPLRHASLVAQDIGPTRTDVRLPADNMPLEIKPLMMAVNRALDRLDEGFRVQREFAADAAHELRTPLTVIRTRLDLVDNQEFVASLRRDLDAISHLVNQLLEFAEVETAEISPDETADLREICENVAAFVAPLAISQRKTVAVTGSEESVLVYGNPEMIRRAVLNLANNAVEHTAEGTTVEFLVQQGGTLSIKDAGSGISPNERELIFQRFWRRDRNRSGSTGLGLPIVRRIIDIHDASIRIEDNPGGGTTFTVAFRAYPHRTPQT
ncbi:sensor histidine kinase [Tardiphaga sp.]|uniref:sensor histidine kinase n=1 Tax=Tardiphaga sp. TaxID=1926292 RepID=UPI003529F95E